MVLVSQRGGVADDSRVIVAASSTALPPRTTPPWTRPGNITDTELETFYTLFYSYLLHVI